MLSEAEHSSLRKVDGTIVKTVDDILEKSGYARKKRFACVTVLEDFMDERQNLPKLGDSKPEDLQMVAKNLKAMIQTGTNDAAAVVESEIRRRPGLFGLMFPGRILKENEEFTIQNMRDVFKTRQEMLKAYINVQLELTRNEGQMIIKSKLQGYEGDLSQQAMQIRTDLTEFSQRKISEMMDTFDRSTSAFAERIDRQTKDAEKYKGNEFLYNKLKQNLQKEQEMFFATISELLDGFKEALKTKLNQN
ncbi:hypothetical protein [Treponema endosymbiont of Eucomonympha sp.]|uniref:hypothetical protein n=1 Tax=Treponema endosymbiont of Eucomonympha sp. TaxID=1580831 RepID=UPI0007823097|nr:hypothetical protein [Treponema endosymbiont of Eucomonympha sp.]